MTRLFEDARRFLEKANFHLHVKLGQKPRRPEFRQEKTDLAAFQRKIKGLSDWILSRDVSSRAELLRLRALTWRERLVDHLYRCEKEMAKLLPARDRAQIIQKYGAAWKVEPVEAKENQELFAWYKAEHDQGAQEIGNYFTLAKEMDKVLKAMEDELERRRDSAPPEKL